MAQAGRSAVQKGSAEAFDDHGHALATAYAHRLEADGTEKAGDEATADLLTQRMQVHEKTAWMLRSLLA